MVEAAAPPRRSMIRSSMIYLRPDAGQPLHGRGRDLVISAKLGASLTPAADAYATALAFPNLFRRIFAEGAFSSAFLPSYARALGPRRRGRRRPHGLRRPGHHRAATIVVTIVCQLAMPWLMYVHQSGLRGRPGKFKLAVILTQISMPYLPGMAIAALLSGVLNARDRFMLSAARRRPGTWPCCWPCCRSTRRSRRRYRGELGDLRRRHAAGRPGCGGGRVTPGLGSCCGMPKLTPEIKAPIIGLAIPGDHRRQRHPAQRLRFRHPGQPYARRPDRG